MYETDSNYNLVLSTTAMYVLEKAFKGYITKGLGSAGLDRMKS